MKNISIEQIRSEVTWRLRQRVMYPEKHFREMELEEDYSGYHFGAFTDDGLIGVVSLFLDGTGFQFRKFAVDVNFQGKGVGTSLLNYITNFAIAESGTRMWCNARLDAIGFYLKNGYLKTGKLYSKNGIDYEIMEKPLTGLADATV